MNTSSTSPSKQSTIDKIREMFKAGHILTSCGAAEKYATADLRRIITTLRRSGMDIVDRWKKSKTSKRYKEYFLREFTPKEEPVSVESIPPVSNPTDNPIPDSSTISRSSILPLQESQTNCSKGYQQTLFPRG